jgi:hypothetical protein
MRFMKDPITLLLRLFGYEVNRKPSLLKMYMHDVTHESFLGTLQRQNRTHEYQYRLYSL